MSNSRLEISGKRFGKVRVIRCVGSDNKKSIWDCVCDCGTKFQTKGVYLRRGNTRSCGCIRGQNATTHHAVGTPTYRTWAAMKTRCLNKHNDAWERYGGRGIKICHRWMKFENFIADMGKRPVGKSLDRFPDKNGDYKPSNCRWATRKEQAQNSRKNVKITFKGQTLCHKEMARQYGIGDTTVRQRIKLGWSLADALQKPVR